MAGGAVHCASDFSEADVYFSPKGHSVVKPKVTHIPLAGARDHWLVAAWPAVYIHYVPLGRAFHKGQEFFFPLDRPRKTGPLLGNRASQGTGRKLKSQWTYMFFYVLGGQRIPRRRHAPILHIARNSNGNTSGPQRQGGGLFQHIQFKIHKRNGIV